MDMTEQLVVCMACGERFVSVMESVSHPCMQDEDLTAVFETILDIESGTRIARALVALAPSSLPLYLQEARAHAASREQKRLFAALAALTPEQMRVFGQYRKAQRCLR